MKGGRTGTGGGGDDYLVKPFWRSRNCCAGSGCFRAGRAHSAGAGDRLKPGIDRFGPLSRNRRARREDIDCCRRSFRLPGVISCAYPGSGAHAGALPAENCGNSFRSADQRGSKVHISRPCAGRVNHGFEFDVIPDGPRHRI